jgi:hypothetical protein
MNLLLVVPEACGMHALPGIGALGADVPVLIGLKISLLFEIGVDALDQAIGIDRDLQDPDLVSEIACEIEPDVRMEFVELFDRQQLAVGAVTNKNRSR